ncbi:MAG: ATP-binding cassette domain-containing protein, partial [Promethearchaeota archaeon]
MGIIEVENLTKEFNGFRVVDNISFTVEEGRIFRMLGPNEARKTTIIFILSSLLFPTRGIARITCFDVVKNEMAVRKSIGIVFQDVLIDDWLIAMENFKIHANLYNIPKKEWLPRAEELLELVELTDRKDDLVVTYSGGMKRRFEIVRGLLNQSKLLFLDAPTLGLDPHTRVHIWQYIRKLNEEFNCIIIIASYSKNIETFFLFSSMIVAPLIFLSNVIFSSESLPFNLGVFRRFNPLNHVVNTVRYLLFGNYYPGTTDTVLPAGITPWEGPLLIITLAIIFTFLGTWVFVRTV